MTAEAKCIGDAAGIFGALEACEMVVGSEGSAESVEESV